MIARIAVRRDTTANWTLANPVLADGEPALDTTTGTVRYGNGVSTWSALPEEGGIPERLSVSGLNATYAIANPALVVTYNGDGSVASTTEDGVLTTFTYNGDGTVATQTRAGITKTFSYGAFGVTGAI